MAVQETIWLYAIVGALGAVSGLAVLLSSKRVLTLRNMCSTVLSGGLSSVMAVAAWYGSAVENPWPAIAASIAIGMCQPKGIDIAKIVLSHVKIRIDDNVNKDS